MHILPVRHHSPASARMVEAAIQKLRPRLILIEGPGDANSLLPYLTENSTVPPVGVLGYLPYDPAQGGSRSVIYPFCDYSPEYVALKAASQLGIEARFFDVPAGCAITFEAEEMQRRLQAAEPLVGTEEIAPDLAFSIDAEATLPAVADEYLAIAQQFGFRHYEEFWEAFFESGGFAQSETLLARLESLGQWVRERDETANPLLRPVWNNYNTARESFMKIQIHEALAEGFGEDEIVVVCGAAHVQGIKEGSINRELVERVSAAPAARLTLIPFSYRRLSEQSGYGAGNAGPAFYQTVWEQGDYWKATQVYLLRLVAAMQARGYLVSLADAIEGSQLALNLAGLRGKPAPGLWELYDVAQACMGRGQVETGRFIQELVIGERIGSLSVKVGRTSVQQEFYDRVATYGLPLRDFPEEKRLYLTGLHDLEISWFLHQLETLEISYATLGTFGDLAKGKMAIDQPPELSQQLAAPREKWKLQWTPYTDMRLIELNVLGDSLQHCCERYLRQELDKAQTVLAASQVLLKAVLCGLDGLLAESLQRLDLVSSFDDDFNGLASAAQNLQDLSRYGISKSGLNSEILSRFLNRIWVRAVMLLPQAGAVNEDGLAPALSSLKILHRLSQTLPELLDAELLARRYEQLMGWDQAHPTLGGLVCCILYLRQNLSQERVEQELTRRLSQGEEPLKAAQFLEGLLSLEPALLLRNKAIVGVLNEWLQAAEVADFQRVLPVLRRTFSTLSNTELNILVETISRLLNLAERALRVKQEVTGGPSDEELAELAAIDAGLEDILGDL
jgi:hypothetical protein